MLPSTGMKNGSRKGGALQPTMLSRWQARSTVPGHCTSRGNNSSTADEPLKCR